MQPGATLKLAGISLRVYGAIIIQETHTVASNVLECHSDGWNAAVAMVSKILSLLTCGYIVKMF